MIILNEFIWRQNHDAFHITNTEAMMRICMNGLIPMCGERSRSVGDDTKGIFFFDCLGSVSNWIDLLYRDRDIYELELLRFNLKGRKWFIHNSDEFYLTNKVLPNRIEYLRIYDVENNIYLPLNFIDYIDDKKILVWNGLEEYEPLIKSKGFK